MNKEPWQRKACPKNKKYKECDYHLYLKEKCEHDFCNNGEIRCKEVRIPIEDMIPNIPWYDYNMWCPKSQGINFPISNKFRIKYSKTHWSLKILLQIYWRYKYIKFITVKTYRFCKSRIYRKFIGMPKGTPAITVGELNELLQKDSKWFVGKTIKGKYVVGKVNEHKFKDKAIANFPENYII